ncbi:MAG: hypothetical protein WA190_01585 [Usitatibacter sp.]
MKQALGVLAVVMISLMAGCATTAGTDGASAAVTKPSVLAAAKGEPLACTGGWHACVCDKEEKCCSFRQDCECGTGANAGKAICR